MRPQNNRGFTLVELGIVVAVLSVLAVVAWFMFSGNSDSDMIFCTVRVYSNGSAEK